MVHLCHMCRYLETYGVELSREQIELGWRSGVLNLCVGDGLDALRTASEPFDVVFASAFFEHLPRETLVEVLEAVHDVLTPGGVLVARTPNGVSPLHGFYFSGDVAHERFLSPRALGQVAVAHGVASFIRACLWWWSDAVIRCVRIETGYGAAVVAQNFVFVASRARERVDNIRVMNMSSQIAPVTLSVSSVGPTISCVC